MAKFNKIFNVTIDPDNYCLLQESMLEQSMQLTTGDLHLFNGEERSDSGHIITVDWLVIPGEKPLKKPDVAGLGAVPLAVSNKTADMLYDGLKDCCEFVPLNLEGEPWFVLNILHDVDAINDELTQWHMRKGKVSKIRPFDRLVLSKSAVKSHGLFRVKRAGLRKFTTDAKGGLYDIVQKYNLTGLEFTEVEAT